MFDQWDRNLIETLRAEKEANEERWAREAEEYQAAQSKHWWHEISWPDVRTNLVAWIIVAVVLILVAALVVRQNVT